MTWTAYERRNAAANLAYDRDYCAVCHGILTTKLGYPLKPGQQMTCEACKPKPIKETA